LNGACMEKIEQRTIQNVIFDAGPVIHLDEIGCLFLLSDFHKLLVPFAVWEEVERYRPSALYTSNVPFIKTQVSEIKASIHTLCNAFNLAEGEKEAISLCLLHPNSILLTDDAAVRLAAKSVGIRAYGSIGILLRAIRRKQLTPMDVIKYLEVIPFKSTLFIKKSLLKEIIEKVKKEYALY